MDDTSGIAALGRADGAAPAAARLASDRRQPPPDVRRECARPACRAPAAATLAFSYAERHVELQPLGDSRAPQTYDLCTAHAARTRPPHGWQLRDRRPEDARQPDVRGTVPADLGGDRTVAVLAAALRAVPGAVSEDAAPAPVAEVSAPLRARPVPAASPRTRGDLPDGAV